MHCPFTWDLGIKTLVQTRLPLTVQPLKEASPSKTRIFAGELGCQLIDAMRSTDLAASRQAEASLILTANQCFLFPVIFRIYHCNPVI